MRGGRASERGFLVIDIVVIFAAEYQEKKSTVFRVVARNEGRDSWRHLFSFFSQGPFRWRGTGSGGKRCRSDSVFGQYFSNEDEMNAIRCDINWQT
jgi:hypothetical protein